MNIRRALTILTAAGCLLLAMPTGATVMGVYPGDLIKLQNDFNSNTHEDEVVYYFDRDWFRRPFPNRKVYLSWYKDFSGVKELIREQMAGIQLGGNIVYRPGTRLVKVPSIPKVYAVEPGGVLRWIETEAVAKALYGDDWAKRVDDVPESFFINYKEGAPLTTAHWPTGTYLRRAADSSLFVIDGAAKRHILPSSAEAFRVNEDFVIRTASDLGAYIDGSEPDAGDLRYMDSAQMDIIETLPPPQVDLPPQTVSLQAGQEQTLLTFRVTGGKPVIIKKLRVVLSGPLWNGSTPNLTDLRFVDAAGESLFGLTQLQQPGAATENVDISGAYTMQANTTTVIELRAQLSAGLAGGSHFTAVLDRANIGLADGGNDDPLPDFFPRASFSGTTLTVE